MSGEIVHQESAAGKSLRMKYENAIATLGELEAQTGLEEYSENDVAREISYRASRAKLLLEGEPVYVTRGKPIGTFG